MTRRAAGLTVLMLTLGPLLALVGGCGDGDSPRGAPSSRSASPLAGVSTDDLLKRLSPRRTRLAAIGELGRRKAPKAVTPLLGHIDDKDPRIRAAALRALGRIGDKTAIQYVRNKLTDKEPDVRLAAAEALGNMPDKSAALWLSEQMGEHDPTVRLALVRALVRIREPLSLKAAARALDDAEPAIHKAAEEGLAAGGLPAVKPVHEVLPRLSATGRLRAVTALARIKHAEAAPALIDALEMTLADNRRGDRQTDARTRAAIADALAAIGEPAIPLLARRAVSRPGNLPLKREAAKVMVRIGRPAVKPIADRITAWNDFPDKEELKIWVQVLQAVGGDDPRAQAALRKARPQLAARTQPTATGPSAVPKGAAEPVKTAAQLAAEEAARGAVSPINIAPAVHDLPETGLVRLVLHGALARADQPPQRRLKDIEIELFRDRGTWRRSVLAKSVTFNQGDHEGVLVKHGQGDPIRLGIEMLIHDDNWVAGGFAAYDVELSRTGGRYGGAYRGRFNGLEVKGSVSVTLQQWPPGAFDEPVLRSGEHPRLLFRRSQLPAMRRRARTDFGRAIVRAMRAKVAAGEQNIDHAIGWGFLHLILGERQYGRQAIPLIRAGIKAGHGGHIHGSARKVLPIAIAYDLAYGCMTDAEREEFNRYVVLQSGALGMKGLGNNCLSANSNWCAISFGPAVVGCLAALREKVPLDLKPPEPRPAVVTVAGERGAEAPAGTPVNEFKDGELIRNWLLAGPFDGSAAGHPLAKLGGCESARPRDGTPVTWAGKTLTFAPLPRTAIRKAPSFIPVPPEIRLPGAAAGARSYLYGLLKVATQQGARVRCSNAPDRKSVHVWIDGRRFADKDIVVLQPGTHRLLVEVVGQAACPGFHAVDHRRQQALWQRYRRRRGQWEAAKALHERNGESAKARAGLTISSRHVGRWFRHAIGDHAWKTEPEGYHGMSLDMVLPAAVAYRTVIGREIVYGTGLPWVAPLGLIRSCPSGGGNYSAGRGGLSDRHLCYAMHLAPRRLQPALVWEFNRRFLPDGLDRLSCQELAFAFVNYPLEVRPEHPEKVMPKVIADRRKGAYVFRNHFGGADDVVTHVFFRSERPNGPAYFHNQAGSFRISGLGTAWAVGLAGDKRNWQYTQENVVQVEPSQGRGRASVTHFSCKPDGSGVLAADMSDVYSARTGLAVRASRHFAVDYGGRSGAPALFAVADRVNGGGRKSWLMHTAGRGLTVEGRTFTIQGAKPGATLRGRFVAPADVRLSAEGSTLRAVSEAKRADYFVIMTLQRGPAPKCAVEGDGLGATVRVGGQEIRFDGRKLLLK